MTVAMPGSDSPAGSGPRFGLRAHQTGISDPRTALAIWTDQKQNRCVLRLRGRLCSDTVRLLDRHVDLLGCQSCDEVVLDLSGVDVMDQVGARVVVGLGHYMAGREGRFQVSGATPAVRSMIAAAEVEISG